MESNKNILFKHYVSIDWSIKDISVARIRSEGNEPIVKSFPSDIKKIKEYLGQLRGKKILTIEETTGSHWLYVELLESVDKLLICDPYRNSLLKEGAKNDKIDARKLCLLLRRRNEVIKMLCQVSGIKEPFSIKIYSLLIDP